MRKNEFLKKNNIELKELTFEDKQDLVNMGYHLSDYALLKCHYLAIINGEYFCLERGSVREIKDILNK